MIASLERVRILMKEIQERVELIEACFCRDQFVESLKVHDEALELKRMFAVERASFGLASENAAVNEITSEFEQLKNRVNASLGTLRIFTREFVSRGFLVSSHA